MLSVSGLMSPDSSARRVPIRLLRGLGLVCLVVVAGGVGAAVGTGNYAVVGGLVAVMLVAGFALYPAAALYSVAFTTLFVNRWVGLGYVPRAVGWMPDLVLLALALRLLVMRAARRNTPTPSHSVLLTLALLGILCVGSMLLNHLGLVQGVVGFRSYLRWPLIFVCVVMLDVGSRTMKRMLVLIVAVSLVQVPVSALQYVRSGGLSDMTSGTLTGNGTGELLVMSMFSMALLMAFVVHGKHSMLLGALGMSLILPPLFGGARASLFLMPALFALLVMVGLATKRPSGWVSAAKVGALAVACAFLFFTFATPSTTVVGENYKSLGGIGVAYEIERTPAGAAPSGRIAALQEASGLISQSKPTRLLGFGPGSVNDSPLVSGNLSSTLSFTAQRNQMSATIVELGYIGPLILLAVFAALWFTLPRLRDDADGFWSAVGWAAPVIVLTSAVMLFYFAGWTVARSTPFLFWMIVAAPFVRLNEVQRE